MTQADADSASHGAGAQRLHWWMWIVFVIGVVAVVFIAVLAAGQSAGSVAPPLEIWTLNSNPPVQSTPIDVRSSAGGEKIPSFEFIRLPKEPWEDGARIGALMPLSTTQRVGLRFGMRATRDFDGMYALVPAAVPEKDGAPVWHKWRLIGR